MESGWCHTRALNVAQPAASRRRRATSAATVQTMVRQIIGARTVIESRKDLIQIVSCSRPCGTDARCSQFDSISALSSSFRDAVRRDFPDNFALLMVVVPFLFPHLDPSWRVCGMPLPSCMLPPHLQLPVPPVHCFPQLSCKSFLLKRLIN